MSEKVSLVATDEHGGYTSLSHDFPHQTVSHHRGEYVRGIVHTQTIDSVWSLLKRGIMGSFHHVSAKYVAEFEWRYNNRKNPDIFGEAIAGC